MGAAMKGPALPPLGRPHPVNKQQKRYGPKPRTAAGKSTIGIYPEVLSEEITLEAVSSGRSIARYGDGELNLAMGGSCISQREASPALRDELRRVLAKPGRCMVGIPNPFSRTPKKNSWLKYATTDIVPLFVQPKYFSSFITRPDSAPWIDTPGYWERMRSLWRGKEVMLVYGGDTSKSLKPEWLLANGAVKVHSVLGKRTNAYQGIDKIEEEIGKPNMPVLICLGPTATVLAWRLAQKGLWAMDLGHVGMFIRSEGGFSITFDDLATSHYRDILKLTHQKYVEAGKPWGQSAYRFFDEILAFYKQLGANTLLDYGCGQQTLQAMMGKQTPLIRVTGYDPGIEGRGALPKPADLVVCTEVLEHVEFNCLNKVLGHINSLALRGAYLTIACSESGEVLSDGRNAHLTIESPAWWLQKMRGWNNWEVVRYEVEDNKKRVRIWLVRTDAGGWTWHPSISQ